MEIQQAGSGRGTKAGVVFEQSFFPYLERNQSSAALGGLVLATDFHLEDLVGVFPGLDPCMSQKGDEAFLESAETAFDFAFGLGSRRNEVSHTEAKEGALKLASGIGVIVTGTWPKEAQAVGVNGFWQSVCFEDAAEMAEVVPGSLGGDETPRDIEAGMIIDGEQEDLFAGRGPPLMDGTVVLKKFTDSRTAEAPIGPLFAQGGGDKMWKVNFDMGLDAGSRSVETAEPLHLIRHELVIGRILQWQEAFEECAHISGPNGATVATAGIGAIGLPVAQEVSTELVEAGSADAERSGGSRCVQSLGIEIGENAKDESGRQAMDNLFLFKMGISIKTEAQHDQKEPASPVGRRGKFAAA